MTLNKEQNDGHMLPVMEFFYSLQGEGYHTGKPAFFIRLGGCDVGCAWCDVKESWQALCHPLVAVDDIIKEILNTKTPAVVITGGEPYIYNLSELTQKIKDKNLEIFIETSGSERVSGHVDWICLSPKRTSPPLPYFYKNAHELKVIIQTQEDFIWAEENAKKVSANCKLFLQPEWSAKDVITPQIIDYIKQSNVHWSLSLQTHKFLNIP